MKRVFVDTSAFFAHLVAEDAHHAEARALFERAVGESWTLITTNAVVWETYTLTRVRARNGRELALGFLEDIQDGLCDIERVRPLDEARAIELLKRYADKKYSFAGVDLRCAATCLLEPQAVELFGRELVEAVEQVAGQPRPIFRRKLQRFAFESFNVPVPVPQIKNAVATLSQNLRQ